MPPLSQIPILDLSLAEDTRTKQKLLQQMHAALFDVGFLYVTNHGVSAATIDRLTSLLPPLFALPTDEKVALSKLNTPHFIGYSGFAEETTLGKQDLREQFDFATELPTVWRGSQFNQTSPGSPVPADSTEDGMLGGDESVSARDFSHLYWRLRGPNQWPKESSLPGFQEALTAYHDEVEALSYRFVHLIEEAFDIPVGTFDHFFGRRTPCSTEDSDLANLQTRDFLPPQHRIKLLMYPPSSSDAQEASQGVGAHKDSSGWLTFLYQVGNEEGLEVLSSSGEWLRAKPIPDSFVVNFGNAFEAATEGAVKATIHRVIAPGPTSNVRYSIPFFMGLPLDMTVSEIRRYIPEHVKGLRSSVEGEDFVSDFLDPRWDSLGESQLRKWIRSHREVGEKWYANVVPYYTQ